MEGRRDGGAELWEKGHDAVDGLNHVCAGLAEDGKEDRGFSTGESQIAVVLDGIDDLCDVAQAHGCAHVSRDDQRLILVSLKKAGRYRRQSTSAGNQREQPLARFAFAA